MIPTFLDIKLSRHYPSLLESRRNNPDFKIKANRLDFIILGAQKAGTSSLYAYMAQHPDIVPALRKEVEFWSWKFYRGLDWYFAHFPQIPEGSHLQTGEACPGYLDFYETAERLRETLPHVKLIVLLRNPVDRAISHYLQKSKKLRTRDGCGAFTVTIWPEGFMLSFSSIGSPSFLGNSS
ncbi:sulfotransferase family protein [Sodalinema gerasimenkoae]|uniref:sulfotransferase family protein n=1 Tax=Sodalinema gerasimenkoae TaxID=2862348 RepID=UPI001359DBC4